VPVGGGAGDVEELGDLSDGSRTQLKPHAARAGAEPSYPEVAGGERLLIGRDPLWLLGSGFSQAPRL
jgi:hypothetical protein